MSGPPSSDPIGHYERGAASYNDHWNADPEYVRHGVRAIIDALRLTSSDLVADVGCGTGLYAWQLAEEIRPDRPVLCVDPVPEMLDQVPVSASLTPILARAEDLAAGRIVAGDRPLDAIVLKESLHHVTARRDTLRGLVDLLSPHGRILVVMLPTTIEHPLFRSAHERFRALQPEPSAVREILADAGLRTSLSYRTFHVTVERERYIHLLESRYMSVLSEFSPDELRAGIDQFRHAYHDPIIRFDDHVAVVKGWR